MNNNMSSPRRRLQKQKKVEEQVVEEERSSASDSNDDVQEEEEEEEEGQNSLLTSEFFASIDEEIGKLTSFADNDVMCYNGSNVLVQDTWDLPVILAWPESKVKISCSVDIGDVYFSLQFVPAPEEGQELDEMDIRTVVELTKIQSRGSLGLPDKGNEESDADEEASGGGDVDVSVAHFEFDAPCEGIILCVFDNTHDWWSNKKVSYNIMVEEPSFRICDEDRAFFCQDVVKQVTRNLEIDNLLMADALDSLRYNEEVAQAQEEDLHVLGDALLSKYDELQLLLNEKESLETLVLVSSEVITPGLRIRLLDRFTLLRIFEFLSPSEVRPVCKYWDQLSSERARLVGGRDDEFDMGFGNLNIDPVIIAHEAKAKVVFDKEERRKLLELMKENFKLVMHERQDREQRERELRLQQQQRYKDAERSSSKDKASSSSSKSVRIVERGSPDRSTSPEKKDNKGKSNSLSANASENLDIRNKQYQHEVSSTKLSRSSSTIANSSSNNNSRSQTISAGSSAKRSLSAGNKATPRGHEGGDGSSSSSGALVKDPRDRDKSRERGQGKKERDRDRDRDRQRNKPAFVADPLNVSNFLSPVLEETGTNSYKDINYNQQQARNKSGRDEYNNVKKRGGGGSSNTYKTSNSNPNQHLTGNIDNNAKADKSTSNKGCVSSFYSAAQINQINTVDYIRKEVAALERLLEKRKELKVKIREWNESFEVENGRKASDREKEVAVRQLYEDFQKVSLKYTVRCDRFDETIQTLNLDHQDVDNIRFGSMAEALQITLSKMEIKRSRSSGVGGEGVEEERRRYKDRRQKEGKGGGGDNRYRDRAISK